MTGGYGADVFNAAVFLSFTPQTDVVTDFTIGEDRMDLRGLGVDGWAAASAALAADAFGDASFGFFWDGEVSVLVILRGVRPEDLSAADFVF